MSLAVFLELVEFKAKTASVVPFLIGMAFSWYNYHMIHPVYVILFFIAMFVFNMSVDILDNYNDYHHATEGHDYKQKTNIIGRENISVRLVFWLMISMILFSAVIGLVLTYLVGWPLLVMGIWCYLVGIFYSSGPRPLSSLPLGEFFSGITMGFMISLICIYLNTFTVFTFDAKSLFDVFLIALPNTFWIANLMLANNICDVEEDEKNERYTIVHYLGKKNALRLFVSLNVLAFAAIILAFVLGLAPWASLLSFLAAPFIFKQTRIFLVKQVKRETFICAVRILAVGSFSQFLSYLLGLMI